MLRRLFREGLSSFKDEILARDGAALPGVTSNHCFFCWYVLTRALVGGLPGGGGQVGNWVGAGLMAFPFCAVKKYAYTSLT